jgi:hypothetical protein
VIFTYQEYHREILWALNRDPTRICIATFNLQVGVSGRGRVYKSQTHDLLQLVQKTCKDTRVLVGVPDNPDFRRLTSCAEYFDKISWRWSPTSHLKCWIFQFRQEKPKALFGGRNLGESDWADASLWLTANDSSQMLDVFNDLFARARVVSKQSVTIV